MQKQKVTDIALFGGEPLFREKQHVGRPTFASLDSLFSRLDGMFKRQWVTNDGPMVRELEQRIADKVSVRNCVATCNGTMALHLVYKALGLRGEVILPSFTFIATAHALDWQGVTPVFCDVRPGTCLIDPAHAASLINERTTGIVGVHTFGQICDVQALHEVASSHGLELVFDASHAFGCTRKTVPVGRFGHAEVFSFHATKAVHSFEGGAVITDDDELATRLRFMRNFGFAGYDRVVHAGINAKMPEVCAAMGLCSLEDMPRGFEENRARFDRYTTLLSELGLEFLKPNHGDTTNWHYVVCLWDENKWGLSRDQLLDLLHAENILARRYFYPGCHRMPYYVRKYAPPHLPCTESLAEQVLVLPTGRAVEMQHIDSIAGFIGFCMGNREEINDLWNTAGSSISRTGAVQ